MTLRTIVRFGLVGGSVALAGSPLMAADPAPIKAPAYTFGQLRPMPAAEARAKVEAWLTSAGKLDKTKLDGIWVGEARPGADVHERVIRSIQIALSDVAALLEESKNVDLLPSTAVPALLKDLKLDPFIRANLAATYAKALSAKRAYEESLETIRGIAAEQLADPASFYFYKAVCEHALIQREPALVSLARLLEDVQDPPDRYRVVATLMYFDIQNWPKDEKHLANIGRLMDNSGRRLDLARGGPKTQEIQKKIIFNLDEKIKQMEEEQKRQQQQQGQGAQAPGQGQGPPTGPMGDSNIATNGGKGTVDEKKLRSYEAVWGKLPEAERKKVILEITRDLPPKYKPMIEDYFRSLNRMHGYKP